MHFLISVSARVSPGCRRLDQHVMMTIGREHHDLLDVRFFFNKANLSGVWICSLEFLQALEGRNVPHSVVVMLRSHRDEDVHWVLKETLYFKTKKKKKTDLILIVFCFVVCLNKMGMFEIRAELFLQTDSQVLGFPEIRAWFLSGCHIL